MKIKKLLVLVDILLIGLVLWLGADIVIGWTSSTLGNKAAPSTKNGEEKQGLSAVASMKSVRNYYYIIARDVFGTAQKRQTSAPVLNAKKVEATQLPLRLKGTVVGDERESYAVIQEGNADKEKLYAVNDKVQSARIIRIESDQVILDVNGKEEALYISYEEKSTPRPRRVPVRRPRAARVVPRVPTQAQAPPVKPLTQPSKVFKPAPGK